MRSLSWRILEGTEHRDLVTPSFATGEWQGRGWDSSLMTLNPVLFLLYSTVSSSQRPFCFHRPLIFPHPEKPSLFFMLLPLLLSTPRVSWGSWGRTLQHLVTCYFCFLPHFSKEGSKNYESTYPVILEISYEKVNFRKVGSWKYIVLDG